MDLIHQPAMLFALMLGWHALADYPLQGDFLATAKNHTTDIGKDLWIWALPSHGLIHGAGVAVLTGSVWLGLAETLAHIAIDRAKCEGWISFSVDQALHIGCKVIWLSAVIAVS
jgi:hypothetical protein